MTLYVRTPEGQIAAFGAESALPRKLKSLLRLVDGTTKLDVLVDNLRAFGDVRGVLQSLHAAGLLKVVGADAKAGAPLPRVTGSLSAPDVSGVPDTMKPSPRSTLPVSPMDSSTRKQALERAVGLMANFVLAHIPTGSFDILRELESMESLEQLDAALGGYAQVIGHLGPYTQDHLSQVRQILREHP